MKVGDSDFTPQMLRAKDAGVDTILSFSNSVEMAYAFKAGNKLDYRPPARRRVAPSAGDRCLL